MDSPLGPYRSEARKGSSGPVAEGADREGWLLLVLLAAVGSVPWVGLVLGGRWSGGELGLATVIVGFGVLQALRSWSESRQS